MNDKDQREVRVRFESAVRLAREAGQLTLRYFRSHDLAVDRKTDDTPVTIADREAEQLVRAEIGVLFPEDAILGEEFGETAGSGAFQWVVDPIDGTKSFIHGVPLYTTLMGILRDGEPVAGVIYAPAAGEMVYAANGQGCWYVDDLRGTDPRPARVSTVPRLSDGLLITAELSSFINLREVDAQSVFLSLHKEAGLARMWSDGYGYLLVATGRAEAMVDPIVNLWDVAGIEPIIREAGGHFSDWQGVNTVHAGEAIGTNALVAHDVLKHTREK